MGKSAKFYKRPNKDEKLHRLVAPPSAVHNAQPAAGSSSKGLLAQRMKERLADFDPMSSVESSKANTPLVLSDREMSDEEADEDEELEAEQGTSASTSLANAAMLAKKKKGKKDKLKAAKAKILQDLERSKARLGGKTVLKAPNAKSKGHVLAGKDYLSMHEKGYAKRRR